jgi:hypothetical protein
MFAKYVCCSVQDTLGATLWAVWTQIYNKGANPITTKYQVFWVITPYQLVNLCVISSLLRDVDEIWALLGSYVV